MYVLFVATPLLYQVKSKVTFFGVFVWVCVWPLITQRKREREKERERKGVREGKSWEREREREYNAIIALIKLMVKSCKLLSKVTFQPVSSFHTVIKQGQKLIIRRKEFFVKFLIIYVLKNEEMNRAENIQFWIGPFCFCELGWF